MGKTTTTVNLGAYLAALGKYVLIVDLDPQANATTGVGINLTANAETVYHALLSGIWPEGIIRKTSMIGLDLMPASGELAGAQVELAALDKRELRLRYALERIRTNYDYILIDCPPSFGLLTVNGLAAGEFILIPVQTEYYALDGLGQLMHLVALVQQNLNPQLRILGAVLTIYDKRIQLHRVILNEVRKSFPAHVFEAVIPRQITLAEAPNFAKTILHYDGSSKAARAYRQLAQEVIARTG